MFINTLHSHFYDYMIENVSWNFADIVLIGERVEVGLQSRKSSYGFNAGKKKEGETNATEEFPYVI